MKILVLGGTQFVGRHIVEALVESGHSVSIFNRGRTPDELPVNIERLRGDRDEGVEGLRSLIARNWDTCIDVSGYTARHVRSSAATLRDNVGHYVFISAVSVYGDPPRGPVDETHPRLPPVGEDVHEVSGESYGRLKVTCENIVDEFFTGRCALLRPQVVAGPHDPYDRFSYWVRRAAQGGQMLAPGDGSDFVQLIDARDVARFTRIVCESAICDAFNLAGPRLMWSDFVDVLGAPNVTWVPADALKAEGVMEFELPLFRRTGGQRSSLMHVSSERAMRAGLTLSRPDETVRNVRKWLGQSNLQPALSSEREAALLRAARGAV
jgi:2'-hydroxyisoflavone reductase